MLMRTLRAGVFAGVLAGVLTAFLQLLLAVPIIAKAELFETGTLVFSASGKPFVLLSDIVPEMRSIQSMTTTAITTIISTVALGLITAAGVNFRGAEITPKQGVMWGFAGFIAFIMAPSFGLPPELPGSGADTIVGRQSWWFYTVFSTIVGLWLIAFKDGFKWVVLGALFIALPHITGTPQPNAYIGKVPPEMSAHFVSVSMGISMVMWTTLGALLAVFYKK